MMNGRTEPVQRIEMFRHAIAHMPFEAIARMRGAEAGHQPVAGDLGDDRGGSDRDNEPVAADHRLAIAAGIDAVAAIDKTPRLSAARSRRKVGRVMISSASGSRGAASLRLSFCAAGLSAACLPLLRVRGDAG